MLSQVRCPNVTASANSTGRIADVDLDEAVATKYRGVSFARTIDLRGEKSVVPGLIDGHTHPVWEGDRVHEFAMKVTAPRHNGLNIPPLLGLLLFLLLLFLLGGRRRPRGHRLHSANVAIFRMCA